MSKTTGFLGRTLITVWMLTVCVGCSHATRHDRFFGTAFIAYLGPFPPKYSGRAEIELPKTSLQRSSPSIQFHILEGKTAIEGGLMRKRPQSELTAFATDVVGGRGVLRRLGPVSEGSHIISIRRNKGVTTFFVDGKVMYTFSARFPMDRNSSVMIGTLAADAGDRPVGSIWNLSIRADDHDLGIPSCLLGSGGIRFEQHGTKWELQGQYDPAVPPGEIGCTPSRLGNVGVKKPRYPIR